MNRRKFVLTTVAATGGLWTAACTRDQDHTEGVAEGRMLPAVGVQLYTLRGEMETNFDDTIRRIAELGYAEVELAGYFGRDVDDIRGLLDEVGLAAPSCHIPLEVLKEDLEGTLDDAIALGHKYVVCPWLAEDRRTLEHYKQYAIFFNEVGKAASEMGIQFAYHNHQFEFEETDGVIPYDVLLADTDPDFVKMELDLYWIRVAGKDPTAYFALHPQRFPLCHVKDMAADGSMTHVGQGEIDFASIFAHGESAGLAHYFVEHDHPEDAWASVTDGFNHLSNLRF